MNEVNEITMKHIIYKTITRQLENGNDFSLKIDGNSMLPFIKKGDIVFVQPKQNNFNFGDLVFIRWGDTYVVHRLLNKRKSLTKGDYLESFDPMDKELLCKVDYGSNRYCKFISIISYIQGTVNKYKKKKFKSRKIYALIKKLIGSADNDNKSKKAN